MGVSRAEPEPGTVLLMLPRLQNILPVVPPVLPGFSGVPLHCLGRAVQQ